MHGFLTDTEIETMTGYKQPAAQIRWLRKWRIRHTVSGSGRPHVTWDAVNGAEKPRVEPNFASLHKAG